MKSLRAICCAAGLLSLVSAAERPTIQNQTSGAALVAALRHLSLDSEQSYRIRDLQLTRGDIKIYFTEGVLSFATAVGDRRVAAFFTTEGVEAGDAEILVLPPRRSERASLASFTNTPNLDEHFASAVFFFSDGTAQELLNQIEAKQVRRAADVAAQLDSRFAPLLRNIGETVDVRLVESLLDNHQPAQGFFYGLIGGQTVGNFQIMYDPSDFEPIAIGSPSSGVSAEKFQLWTSFRPRHAPPYIRPTPREQKYRIEATIHPDLSMSASAAFDWIAHESDGRVVVLALSERLKVESATVDGKPAELVQHTSDALDEALKGGRKFLLIVDQPLTSGTVHNIEVRYRGSVIRQTPDGSYLVDERNAWFPYTIPTLANFDLTFHCPASLRLVSIGEPVSDDVLGDERTVHRKTEVPESLAGFNLGDYNVSAESSGAYRVECYANRSSAEAMANIADETGNLLNYFTEHWVRLPIQSIAVSPIPGYLGQGFPGLVYLSSASYTPQENRPLDLRNERLDAFSQLLLPHEVAHQWWGNIVTPADYRSAWIMEAMANDAALEFIAQKQGAASVQSILETYRKDLTFVQNGKRLDTAGPVDFGVRLRDTANDFVWHAIIYEKGAWILRMLRQRLGDDGFRKMQVRLLAEYARKPLTNEDFQAILSQFVPAGQPDKTLSLFFDSWVYGTGIPKLALTQTKGRAELELSEVEEDFTADIPLPCRSKDGKQQVHWLRASKGSNEVELSAGSETCTLPALSDFLYFH